MLLLYTCVGHTLPPRALRGAAHGAAYARPLDLGAAYARPLVLRAAQPPLLLLDEESGDINDGGISSVDWVTVDASGPDVEPTEEEGTSVMPLFPLGAAYLPHTTPVLNIFEPRYRAMYNDILFNGARRFMVTNVEPETGALAEVGVVFYLDELKEVSEQTQDRVKYIGQHRVINRVRLRRVLNPSVVATRDTYLKAEVEVLSDSDQQEEGKPDEGLAAEEAAAEELFVSLVDAQKSLGEEPRFTDAVKGSLSFARGTSPSDRGLWGTIGLWQQFLEQRTQVLGQKMQREIQSGVASYLSDNSLREDLVNARGEIRLQDLPPELIAEIEAIQRRYRGEVDALDGEPGSLRFQALLQSDSHRQRLALFCTWLRKEQKRLATRKSLQSLFSSGDAKGEGEGGAPDDQS